MNSAKNKGWHDFAAAEEWHDAYKELERQQAELEAYYELEKKRLTAAMVKNTEVLRAAELAYERAKKNVAAHSAAIRDAAK